MGCDRWDAKSVSERNNILDSGVTMTAFKIDRNDLPPLEFEGELIFRTSGPRDGRQRGYDLHLYAAGDRFVPVIEFVTAANRPPITIAEIVDDAENVEKFFFVFEPLEYLDQHVVEEIGAEQRQALTLQLFRLYDAEVAKTLDAVDVHLGRDPRSKSLSESGHQSPSARKQPGRSSMIDA